MKIQIETDREEMMMLEMIYERGDEEMTDAMLHDAEKQRSGAGKGGV